MDLEMENSGNTRGTMLSIILVIGVNSYLVGPEKLRQRHRRAQQLTATFAIGAVDFYHFFQIRVK